MTRLLVDVPSDTSTQRYTRLGYLEAYDAVLDCDYAFVAYREQDGDGAWRIRIRSSQTAGAVFEPPAIEKQARAAGARGEASFAWGYSFDPSPSDPRCIRFLVHVEGGKPAAVEMTAQLRCADGSPDTVRAVRFPWPA